MAIDKQTTVEITNYVYATWNREPSPAAKKDVYRTWHDHLADLEADAVYAAIRRISVVNTKDGWMPTPGDVRRETIGVPEDQPTALQGWLLFRQWAEEMSMGTGTGAVHPLVHRVIQRLGPGAAGLVTNDDRRLWLEEWRAVTKDDELHRYGVE